MDPSAFDQFSRTLATTPTRRTTLAGVAGAFAAFASRLVPANIPSTAARPKLCRPLGRVCFPGHGVDCCRGATCQNGRCRCPKRTRRCGSRCLPKSKCCRHQDCPGNQRCTKGRCQCPAGMKRCQGRCLAKNTCCGGCAVDQICKHGACVANPCGNGRPCRVFVTSQSFTGNLGGVGGADRKCQAAANASKLARGGTYKAWISAGTPASSPSQRFTNRAQAGPYVLVNGTVVANDWADLTTSKSGEYLRARINVTELGTTATGTNLTWTATATDGSPSTLFEGPTCQGWTIGNNVDVYGGIGNWNRQEDFWTAFGTWFCTNDLRLVCFEQS